MISSSTIGIIALIGALVILAIFMTNTELQVTGVLPISGSLSLSTYASQLEEIRKIDQVQLIDDLENEKTLGQLPNGVYGYVNPYELSLSFDSHNTPQINRENSDKKTLFEIHKSNYGSERVLGFVSEETLIGLKESKLSTFQLFVNPWPEYNNLIAMDTSPIESFNIRDFKNSYVADVVLTTSSGLTNTMLSTPTTSLTGPIPWYLNPTDSGFWGPVGVIVAIGIAIFQYFKVRRKKHSEGEPNNNSKTEDFFGVKFSEKFGKAEFINFKFPKTLENGRKYTVTAKIKGSTTNGFLDLLITDPDGEQYWYVDPQSYVYDNGNLELENEEYTAKWEYSIPNKTGKYTARMGLYEQDSKNRRCVNYEKREFFVT